jgi:LysM repeat protein
MMEFLMLRNFLVVRIWLVLMVLVISLSGTPVLALAGTVVRVEPSALSANINDTVSLSIKVDNVANLTALELHLSFNPAVLEVTQVSNGGFVAADFIAQNVYNNTTGTIDFAVAQMNRTPAQGNGTLLNITFKAKANGSSTLSLRSTQAVQSGMLLSDNNGTAIQAAWANGIVTVGGQAGPTSTPVTPVPATSTPVTPGAPTATPVTPGAPTATPVTPAAATATKIPTTTPAPAGRILGTHSVRWGESLYCIGRAYKVSPWAIADENGIWWPYLIFPYQSLRIPNVPWVPVPSGTVCQAQFIASAATATPTPTATQVTPGAPTATPVTPAPATATPVPSAVCHAYYTVVPGDTLYSIAVRYGTTYSVLASVNQISNPRLINSGQRLCIP